MIAVVPSWLDMELVVSVDEPRVMFRPHTDITARPVCYVCRRMMQRKDGGWPYALDLDGKSITHLADAGQIWCAWAMWKMHEYTGLAKYKEAALKAGDFYKRTFMDEHRYMGYWEDVSGAAGKVNRSWEAYEPAIACFVFDEMGRHDLVLDSAKDLSCWTWTRVISTRQYETCLGETTEQALSGPSQAQSPMVGAAFQRVFKRTRDPMWRDYSGAVKAVNFAADPEQGYCMVATCGWDNPLYGVGGPPYDNVRPSIRPFEVEAGDPRLDRYIWTGRYAWNEWCTTQFAWLSLYWLIEEGNIRAEQHVQIDPDTLRGTVLGIPGRIKMAEEACDVNGFEHYDINWVGYCNAEKHMLLIMNHQEKLSVAVRPHEAHMDVFTREPVILISEGKDFVPIKIKKKGTQYFVKIPTEGTALMIWDRIK